MGKEGGRLPEETRRLPEDLRAVPPTTSSRDPVRLEEAARRLLRRFQEGAECLYFNAFYHLTRDLFHACAVRYVARTSLPIDPAEMTHRMYIILFEKLLAPDGKVPLDYLFPWCYRVLFNLVRGERTRLLRSRSLLRERPVEVEEPSAVTRVLEAEARSLERGRYHQVVETLFSERSGLSPRDRIVMRRFYLEGKSLRAIGEELGLSKSHVGVILMRTRRRIARYLAPHHPPPPRARPDPLPAPEGPRARGEERGKQEG